MSTGFNYSKWDNIELSDDEDDVHPNIERESWFRMKHRSRVEREEKEDAEKKRIKKEMGATDLRIREIDRILKSLDSAAAGDDDDSDDDDLEDRDGMEAELKELRRVNRARQEKLDEYEKTKKWNVDNMCRVVEERTIISTGKEPKFSKETGFIVPDDEDGKTEEADTIKVEKGMAAAAIGDKPKKEKNATEKNAVAEKKPTAEAQAAAAAALAAGPEREQVAMLSYHDFTEKYADRVEEFMAIRDLEKCKEFIIQNGNVLLQENASNYLLLASLEDEMNGFHDKMRQTARQSQIVSNIAELAKSLKAHPGNVILPFFQRLEQREFLVGFLDGVKSFVEKIKARAIVKRKEIDEERAQLVRDQGVSGDGSVDLTEMPKEERLGPGGLDPVEVFDSLPISMQEAFESRDTDNLKNSLLAMDPGQAEYHMKRCVDSGLWNEGQ